MRDKSPAEFLCGLASLLERRGGAECLLVFIIQCYQIIFNRDLLIDFHTGSESWLAALL